MVDVSRTRTCQVCRGSGVCGCPMSIETNGPWETFSGCDARERETFGDWGGNTVFHDGRTCHNCRGIGVRPIGVTPDHLRAEARAERGAVIAHHLATVGPVCPGFGRPPHEVDPGNLTADHVRPRAKGGAPTGRANLGVLCRSCNARKSHRVRSAPSRAHARPTAPHTCTTGCVADLHASEIVVVGSINRDHAQRFLRRRYGIPALFVEYAGPSDIDVAERPPEVRHVTYPAPACVLQAFGAMTSGTATARCSFGLNDRFLCHFYNAPL